MGCSSSSAVGAAPGAEKNEVDALLEAEREKDDLTYKVLLLGAGEAGKSTVVKQLKMIYKGGITPKEKEDYIHAIRKNAIETMQNLLEAMEKLGINFQDEAARAAGLRVAALGMDAQLDPTLAEDICTLWADPDMKTTYSRRDEYWHLDATHYYLNNVLRFAEEDFSPSEEDMIMTRTRTTGIVVSEFQDPPLTFNVVDVGGQRSERRKWIHCFDDVRGIIFLASLADYCQVLFEDSNVNRMHESLSLFGEVTKNPAFEKTPLFVFLNKKDLFEDYIRVKSLKMCFPEYDGPDGEAPPAVEYIQKKYREVLQKSVPGKEVAIHIVAARVRMDMKIAFADVKDSLKKIYSKKKR